MIEEGMPVWAFRGRNGRLCFQQRQQHLALSQHRGTKTVQPRARRKQKFRDIPMPGMRGAAQGSFPIAATPIPGSENQVRFLGDQFLYARKVIVPGPNEGSDELKIQRPSSPHDLNRLRLVWSV